MQERYLFKAKRTDNGKWMQGYLYGIWERRYIMWGMTNDIPYMVEVDPSTICQCTGLKDKNGKLIFENDIMEAHLDDKFPEDVTRTRVIWDKNGWATIESGAIDRKPLDDFDTENFEVIGNAIDNPELLEVNCFQNGNS